MVALKRMAFWNRSRPVEQPIHTVASVQSSVAPAVAIPTSDPLYAYCLSSSGVIDVDALKINSEAVRALREAEVKLLIPLINQGELVGLMQLGPRLSDQEYSSDDHRLLSNLAPQAAVAVRVAQLAYQQQVEARRRERIEQELRVAGIIQQTLLPKAVPSLEGWQLASYWQPARTVGGDFYDFIYLRDGRLLITIGDVTDKGMPAALVMASTRSILRSVAEQTTSPGEMLRRANDMLFADMPPNMFVTCLCAVLDPQTGKIKYANAGHNPSQQSTKGGVVELRARGMPLGLMPEMQYEEKETVLAQGDTLLLYSDGLVEAHNGEREMFGMARLQTSLVNHEGDLIAHMRDTLAAFTGEAWEQEDDVTLVVIQRQISKLATEQGTDIDWRILDLFELPSAEGGEREAMDRIANVADTLLPTARLERLKTAVAETVMNAMEHGNHYQPDLMVKVHVAANQHELIVSVTDQGGVQPVIEATAPDLEAKLAGTQSARGWGIFLIKTMVDAMRTRNTDSEHTVELVMKLDGDKNGTSNL